MANPNPVRTAEFLAWQEKIRQRRQGEVEEPLAKESVGVRLPQSVDRVVRRLPQRSAWLRRVVEEAARREFPDGFTSGQHTENANSPFDTGDTRDDGIGA